MSRKASSGNRASPVLAARFIARAQMGPDAGILRHHHHLADAGSGKSGENAQHDVGAVGDLKAAGVSDHPANVAGRNRIGNDTHDRTGHDSLPHDDSLPNNDAWL